jgi:hypothetical protein
MVKCVLPSFRDWIARLPSEWLAEGLAEGTPDRVSGTKRKRAGTKESM